VDVRRDELGPVEWLWGDGGLLATGNYDIMMSRDGRYPDPAAWVAAFTSSRIPSDQNPNGTTNSH
jgi:peptide/nickel transport system substrate-binding protein